MFRGQDEEQRGERLMTVRRARPPHGMPAKAIRQFERAGLDLQRRRQRGELPPLRPGHAPQDAPEPRLGDRLQLARAPHRRRSSPNGASRSAPRSQRSPCPAPASSSPSTHSRSNGSSFLAVTGEPRARGRRTHAACVPPALRHEQCPYSPGRCSCICNDRECSRHSSSRPSAVPRFLIRLDP